MAYNSVTDFIALLRQTAGGVRSARMPGLDYVLLALNRMGFVSLWVSQTAPTVNQPTTVWLKPASPSYTAEGQVYLWDTVSSSYLPATPALWSTFIASPFVSLIPSAGSALPLMNGAASAGGSLLYSRQDHVHPTDTSLAPINSPTFIGSPKAPTQAIGDNTTNIATTAFVIANGGLPPPIGSVIAYAGTSAPSAQWAICNGQAISRSTFATLFGLVGITFGSGDGTTTFNIPDLRGRVIAGVDGGANRLTTATMSSQSLAGVGGLETINLTLAQLPTGITSSGSGSGVSVTSSARTLQFNGGAVSTGNTGAGSPNIVGYTTASDATMTSTGSTGTVNSTSNNTSGSASNNVQPTMELTYLMRVA